MAHPVRWLATLLLAVLVSACAAERVEEPSPKEAPPIATPVPAPAALAERRDAVTREVEEKMLQRIRRSTVLVDTGTEVATGVGVAHTHQGYVVLTRGYLPRGAEVVVRFAAGTPDEKRYRGTFLTTGPFQELSLLQVPDAPSSQPLLDLARGSEGDVYETQPVLIPGYPLARIAGRRRRPKRPTSSLTFTGGRVSSLRRAPNGFLEGVQLDADLHRGNRGSPVIDDTGAVVGVAVGGLGTTDISYMVPASKIELFVDGSIVQLQLQLKPLPWTISELWRGGRTRVRATLSLLDPLGQLERVGVNVLPRGTAPPAEARSWPFRLIGETVAAVKVAGDEAVVDFEIESAGGKLWLQAWFENRSGRLPHEPIELELKRQQDSRTLELVTATEQGPEPTAAAVPEAAPRTQKAPEAEVEPEPPAVAWEPGDWLGIPPAEPPPVAGPAPEPEPLADRGEIRLAAAGDRSTLMPSRPLSGVHREITPQLISPPAAGGQPATERQTWGEVEVAVVRVERKREFFIEQPFVHDVVWWDEGRRCFLLRADGLLRRLAMPELGEDARLDLAATASAMTLTRQGLLVLLTSVQEIVVVDPQTLRPRCAVSALGATGLVGSPASSLAFYRRRGDAPLVAVDVAACRVAMGIEGMTWQPPATGDSGPAEAVSVTGFDHPLMTADGRSLLFIDRDFVHRVELADRRLRIVERSPQVPGATNPSLSPDGRYVAVLGSARERSPQSRLLVFKVTDLSAPVLAFDLRIDSLARWGIDFDPRRGEILVPASDETLLVFDARGALRREIEFSSNDDYLLHRVSASPAGDGAWLFLRETLVWAPAGGLAARGESQDALQ